MYTDPHTGVRRPAFRKHLQAGESPIFHAEALCLSALAASGAVRTPDVLFCSSSEIMTARIEEGAASTGSWIELGEQLASLHCLSQPAFGFTGETFCGANRQPNPQMADGHRFFNEHRLQFQADMAVASGLLSTSERNDIDTLCAKLIDLVPQHGPALLHGDLWRGNVLFNKMGQPVVIDPACYWGWPEADVAMCALFGGFPTSFFQAWSDAYGAEQGWHERFPIYQLYHLLNHLNLFGGSYHREVTAILQKYC